MGFFKKKQTPQSDDNTTAKKVDVTANGNDKETFEYQFYALIPRYLCKPDSKNNKLIFKDASGNPMPLADAFPEQFETWKGIKSFADRRGLIFSMLDTILAGNLELWQTIERLNDDRQADKALQTALEIKPTPEEEQSPNSWSALARTNFILCRCKEAEECCLKAFAIDKDDIRTKRIYADILHVTGRQEEANGIYNEILERKLPKDKEMSIPLQDLLGFKGDIMNSPVYAFSWLQSDKNVTADIWDWANEEFYYSPHFRAWYAYLLIEKGEAMKGFVKLLVLSQEMPWFKEGVTNALSVMKQLNLTEHFSDEKIRLEELVSANNW